MIGYARRSHRQRFSGRGCNSRRLHSKATCNSLQVAFFMSLTQASRTTGLKLLELAQAPLRASIVWRLLDGFGRIVPAFESSRAVRGRLVFSPEESGVPQLFRENLVRLGPSSH